MTRRWTDCEGFHRRDFIKLGTAGLVGLTLPELLRLESQAKANPATKASRKATNVIMIWLAGGPATIDMWDLKPDAPDGIRGEFKPIDTTAPGVKICEHLPQMAKVMNQCTLVRSLYHNIAAHELGTIYMTTGNRPTPALQYPALGSLTTKLLPAEPGVPPYVVFGGLRNGRAGLGGYLGTAYNPFEVEGDAGGKQGQLRVRGVSLPAGFSLDDLENRNKLLEAFDADFKALDKSADISAGMDRFQEQALEILRSNKTKQAFDLNREDEKLRDRYGKNPFGQGVLAARRLIEAGVRFVTVSLGGWDTHNNNFVTLKQRLLPQVDQTLSALIADLAEKGQLDNTVVYCAGEFNRTPKINPRAGRDHWGRSMSVVLAGGGFRKSYCHGTTDASGMAPATDACLPDDVSATIFHLLGLDPHQELMTPSGRPIALFREGKVLNTLLA